jgi:hypothetical protein
MDRLASYIARSDPNVKAGDSTDNVVVLEKEKSVSNKNEKATNLVFTHKPAAEVFKNPDLLAAAKLARTEIKKQLIASGRATNVKAETILDNLKYNSVTLDRKGYGKDVEKVVGSTSFHLMAQVLKINTEKFRIEDTPKTLNAGASKSRAKRGTGVFQPAAIQTGRSTDSQQKKTTVANTKQTLIEEESPLSENDFVFSTFPSDSGEALPDTASDKNKSSSNSTSVGWRAAKPTTARPEQSTTTQPMPSSSSNEKKN